MKKLFYTGLIGLLLFEFLKVYFIMPMPGSQNINSLGAAYFLHAGRWFFRLLFLIMIVIGGMQAFGGKRKWLPALTLVIIGAMIYVLNFKMSADHMFLQPNHIMLKPQSENKLAGSRLVIGVELNGEAKAYPVEFLTYHHQVQDSIGGKPVIVTYCSVCRTGRVYEPIVNGKHESFRLVGMDHFNAMFEDATTGSWWRQATGEAVAGKLKGESLPEVSSEQMTLHKFFELHASGKVLQPDNDFTNAYDPLVRFEQGKSRGSLTRTDSLSWKNKSWVVGVQTANAAKAYDWNALKQQHIINDTVGGKAIVLVLSQDGQSFAAFERPQGKPFTMQNDILFADSIAYNFSGQNLSVSNDRLQPVKAYQEFWHSWATFHPATQQYVIK